MPHAGTKKAHSEYLTTLIEPLRIWYILIIQISAFPGLAQIQSPKMGYLPLQRRVVACG